MAQPDPAPNSREQKIRRFKRIVKLLALLSFVIAVIAVIFVASGDEGFHIHMLIATALGAGLTVFLGTALMSLAFLSSSSGHDDEAAKRQEPKD